MAGTLAEEDWLVRLCLSLWLRSTPDILSIKSWNHTSSSIMMLSSSLVAASDKDVKAGYLGVMLVVSIQVFSNQATVMAQMYSKMVVVRKTVGRPACCREFGRQFPTLSSSDQS